MSALWIDVKYANIVSSKLLRFKVTRYNPYTANFRCPFCGDSKKSATKARGFFFQKEQSIIYRCHNCGIGKNMRSFLADFAPELRDEYIAESFLENRIEDNLNTEKPVPEVFELPKFLKAGSPLRKLKKISQLPWNHPAKQYIINRGIPNEYHSKLFYCSKFASWTNTMIPGKLKTTHDIPRLIIPLLDKDGRMFGYQGRSFDPNDKVRYISIMLDDRIKVYGLDTVDFSKKYYILEGPIDSMFLPNAIAMAGSDMSNPEFLNSNAVFVYDNEPRNRDIVNRVKRAIGAGYTVCIWPSMMEQYKDINDMISGGYSQKEIVDIINSNSYNGITAIVHFNDWKKIS